MNDSINRWIEELCLWSKAHNLMSTNELGNLPEHLADSLSLAPFLEDLSCPLIVDIGSGGGFPVVPLAFWAKEHEKPLRFIATDVVDKKIAFLKWSRSKFSLPMEVVKVDKKFLVEDPCLVISRAYAGVDGILKWTKQHLAEPCCYLLLKGKKAEEELASAGICDYQLFPNPRGFVVKF